MTLHWAEYGIEGALLGAFMVSACLSVVVVEHPASPVRRAMRSGFARRGVVGICMGLTAVALISSVWGQRSGAHMNPAVTVSFFVLGKIAPMDAAMYIGAQFAGGTAGVLMVNLVMRRAVAHPCVNFLATEPRPVRRGVAAAWGTEFAISFVLMITVLEMSNETGAAAYTGIAAGVLVAAYIAFAAPWSGMSMNPARSFASSVFAGNWRHFWVYCTAPTLAMATAAMLFPHLPGPGRAYCAKLCHADGACLFRCEILEMRGGRGSP